MDILYIEDEPSDAALVGRYINTTGHQYENVASFEAASERIAANQPDLILVDMIINHTRKGFAFVHALRDQGYTRPIIAVTGLALDAEIKQCYAVGCNAVLVKPYTIMELVALLDKYLKS